MRFGLFNAMICGCAVALTGLIWADPHAPVYPPHIGIKISDQAVKALVTAELQSMTERHAFVIEGATLVEKISFEKPQYERLTKSLKEFYGIDLKTGIKAYISYDDVEAKSVIPSENIKFSMRESASGGLDIKAGITTTSMSIGIPSLRFCLSENCSRTQPMIGMKSLIVQLDPKTPLTVNLTAHLGFERKTTTVNGASFDDSVAHIKVLSADFGTSAPHLILSHDHKGFEMTEVQFGPAGFGIAIKKADVLKQIDQLNGNLGRELVKRATKMMTQNLVRALNAKLAGSVLPAAIHGAYETAGVTFFDDLKSTPHPDVMKTSLASFWDEVSALVANIKYGFSVSDLWIDSDGLDMDSYSSQPKVNVGIKPQLYVNDISYQPGLSLGHGRHERSLRPVEWKRSDSRDLGVGIALSEPYLNSILDIAQRLGLTSGAFQMLTKQAGLSVAQDGVKLHFFENKVYAVLNLEVRFSERASWLERDLGALYEKVFGNTGAVLRFPLEIPFEISLEDARTTPVLVLQGVSPIASGELANTFGYDSNLGAATGLVRGKVIKALQAALAGLQSGQVDRLGRAMLKPIRLPLAAYLDRLPVKVVPAEIRIEDSGHLVLYSDIQGALR